MAPPKMKSFTLSQFSNIYSYCTRVSSKQSIFFSVRTETQSVSVVFRFVSRNQKTFFSMFRTSIETTETNRIFSKQTEKISKKLSLLRGPRNRKFFFLVRTEKNRNSICFSCFSVCFFANLKKKNFGLFRCFGPVSKQRKQTELMVWGIKKVDILTN